MKKLTSFLIAALLLLSAAAPAYAAQADTAVPYYTNTSQASVSLVIDEDGNASWTIICVGKSTATAIDSVTYLERQVGDSWVRVDLGITNNEYTYSTTASRMVQSYDASLTVSGTYRAVVVFTVYGTSEDETITLWNTRSF